MEIFTKSHDGFLKRYEADPPVSEVIVRKQVKGIGSYCFGDNKDIVSVTLPETVKEIWPDAFHGCSSLETVSGLINVVKIYRDAFLNCKKLNRFDIPEDCEIEGTAFKGCSKWYDANGFLIINNKLCHYRGKETDVVVPEAVKTIGEWAFEGNKKIKSVTFPEELKAICVGAFKGCKSLNLINIPANLENIGNYAFEGCDNLAMKIVLPEKTKNAGFSKSGIKEIVYSHIKDGEYFYYNYLDVRSCKQLERVTVPATMRILENNLNGCTALKEIIAPGTSLKYIGTTLSSARIKYPAFMREAAVVGFVHNYYKYEEQVFEEYIDYLNLMLPKYAAVIIKNDAYELLESIDLKGNAVQKYKDSLLIPLAEAFGAEKCLEKLRTSTGRGRKK